MGRLKRWIPGILAILLAAVGLTFVRAQPLAPIEPLGSANATIGGGQFRVGDTVAVAVGFFSSKRPTTLRDVRLLDVGTTASVVEVRAFVAESLPVPPLRYPHGCTPLLLSRGSPESGVKRGAFQRVSGLTLKEGQQFQVIAYFRLDDTGPFNTGNRVRFTFDRRPSVLGAASQDLPVGGLRGASVATDGASVVDQVPGSRCAFT